MRAPAITGRDDEGFRAVLDRIGGAILMKSLRGGDGRPAIVEDETADERTIVEDDLLWFHQLAEREVW